MEKRIIIEPTDIVVKEKIRPNGNVKDEIWHLFGYLEAVVFENEKGELRALTDDYLNFPIETDGKTIKTPEDIFNLSGRIGIVDGNFRLEE